MKTYCSYFIEFMLFYPDKKVSELIKEDIRNYLLIKINEHKINFSIEMRDAETFLNSLKKGKGHSNEWELEIGKLEALTLLGNDRAKYILENYEDFTGTETDGAERETWKDAKAITEWIKK